MSAAGATPSLPAGVGQPPPADSGGARASAHRWVFALTVVFLWAAAVLRSVLEFDGGQRLLVVTLLVAWLGVVVLGELAARRRHAAFRISLAAQLVLVVVLLTQSDSSDFYAMLLAVPTMQAMTRWRPRSVAALIGVFAALTWVAVSGEYGLTGALPLVAIYAAADVFFAAYAYAAARSDAARARSEALAADLRETNRRLAESAEQAERLGAERERQQLARDLHDSVTQTLFSMNLTAQSALLLLRRDPRAVSAQLAQIEDLARAAREELEGLKTGGPSRAVAAGGISAALDRLCEERRRRDGLEVALELEGEGALTGDEEQALLRIAQEGLNNVVKHAGVGRAVVRFRAARPVRLEVEDGGSGFDPETAGAGGGLGLVGMRERAAELGWLLSVTSAPGAGTRVVVEEPDAGANAPSSEGGRGRDRA